jgi:hypothetical protein
MFKSVKTFSPLDNINNRINSVHVIVGAPYIKCHFIYHVASVAICCSLRDYGLQETNYKLHYSEAL